jgi:hypothetical protein
MNTQATHLNAPAAGSNDTTAPISSTPIQNPATVPIVPQRSDSSTLEAADSQMNAKKPHPESLEEKISDEQRSRLFEWLAEHSYSEVQDLVAAEPPTGFGFTVGKTTLCRFYKTHFTEIDTIRQLRIDGRAYAMSQMNAGGDYVELLHDSSRQLLLERYFEMLSRPVESIDELKKLVAIGEKVKDLHAEERRAKKVAELFGARPSAAPQPPVAPGESDEDRYDDEPQHPPGRGKNRPSR